MRRLISFMLITIIALSISPITWANQTTPIRASNSTLPAIPAPIIQLKTTMDISVGEALEGAPFLQSSLPFAHPALPHQIITPENLATHSLIAIENPAFAALHRNLEKIIISAYSPENNRIHRESGHGINGTASHRQNAVSQGALQEIDQEIRGRPDSRFQPSKLVTVVTKELGSLRARDLDQLTLPEMIALSEKILRIYHNEESHRGDPSNILYQEWNSGRGVLGRQLSPSTKRPLPASHNPPVLSKEVAHPAQAEPVLLLFYVGLVMGLSYYPLLLLRWAGHTNFVTEHASNFLWSFMGMSIVAAFGKSLELSHKQQRSLNLLSGLAVLVFNAFHELVTNMNNSSFDWPDMIAGVLGVLLYFLSEASLDAWKAIRSRGKSSRKLV